MMHMESSLPFTHKAECPRYNSAYTCRDTRLPENRHLGEIVPSEVRQVCKSYYMNEIARTLNNAAVCRCEQNIASSSSSTFPLSGASSVDGIKSKHNSSAFFHSSSHAANKAVGGESSSPSASYADSEQLQMNDDMTSPYNQKTSNKQFNTVNVGRTNTLLKSESTKKFRCHAHVVNNKEMCLCGLLSLSLSVHLICCIEAFFSMVLLVQAPDLLVMNGRYFYFLGLFNGGGETLFAIHVIMCVSCALTALLLYFGTRTSSPLLLLPHFIWQCTFIAMSLIISTVLLILGFRGDILLPSSIVLSVMLIVPAICEIWWSYLTFCHYRHLAKKATCKSVNADEFRAFSPSVIISTRC
ncbi:hypothetical protein Angca_001448 [Angiostrongylus cantonensis]|nr:hypothetical protein Angca_001448 [Angiostrongylus cantonensis]